MPAMDPESWHRAASALLLTDVPGDIATGIAVGAVGIGSAAVTALWRRLTKVEDRGRADKAEMVKAITEAALAARAATDAEAARERDRTELWRRTYSLLERLERRLDERAG